MALMTPFNQQRANLLLKVIFGFGGADPASQTQMNDRRQNQDRQPGVVRFHGHPFFLAPWVLPVEFDQASRDALAPGFFVEGIRVLTHPGSPESYCCR